MSTSAGWSHQRAWPGEAVDVAGARQYVAHHLEAHQMVCLVDDATLVVSELATNAVAHAGTPFTVTLAQHNGGVEIVVSDGTSVLSQSRPSSTSGVGGRGLQLVGSVSQDWGVRLGADQGKSVWAVLTP